MPVHYHQMLVSPHVGGGAKLAFEIHRYVLDTQGPVSRLLLPGGGEAERVATAASFDFGKYRVDRLTGAGRYGSLVENAQLALTMARYGRGVVHVHAPFVYGAARPFLSVSGLKTVLHIHLDFSAEQLQWALQSPPDLVVVCAEFMRPAVLQALGEGNRVPVKVIRNAVDLRRFAADRSGADKPRQSPSKVPVLMMVANLAPHKGQETALRAVARLQAMGREVKLMLVGAERSDGQGHEAYLRNLCQQLGIVERVEFAGFRNDVPELLATADFVLLPSTSEGLPLVILEAQASGAIVLAAPTAGIPEVIDHGRTGFLIGAADDEGYAATLARLLASPAEISAIRTAAHAHVKLHHDMTTYCSRMVGEYDQLLRAS